MPVARWAMSTSTTIETAWVPLSSGRHLPNRRPSRDQHRARTHRHRRRLVPGRRDGRRHRRRPDRSGRRSAPSRASARAGRVRARRPRGRLGGVMGSRAALLPLVRAHRPGRPTTAGRPGLGRARVVASGREDQPFTVHVRHEDGRTGRVTAGAVVDASGTWTSPNPLGSDGYPADGEHEPAVAARVSYRVPDVSTADDVARFGGRRTAVVGSGHSALTALVALATLAEKAPGTTAVWVLCRGAVGSAYGGGDADQLPARGALGLRARDAVAAGHIEVVTGFRTLAVEHVAGGALALVSEDGRRVDGLDEVVGVTGFRPDHSIMSELRLRLDDRLEAPRGLAPLIDPNVHSCGTVYPHGAGELAHDEQGVYVVGMKAYGRAPTFLALTGYEQVRSVAAALAGDHEAASRVELALPETGVCGGAGLFDEPAATTAGADGEEAVGGCCAPAVPQLVQIGAPSGSGGACGPAGC